MKKFDLEKALAGEPVVLRNGSKAFIVKHIPEDHIKKEECELIGYLVEGSKFHSCVTWTKDGKYNPCFSSHIYDIIGMYEEPRPTETLTLPCPLKDVAIGDEIYILSGYSYQNNGVPEVLVRKHNNSTELFNAINFGLAFKTKEDAEAWLHAMKNARK